MVRFLNKLICFISDNMENINNYQLKNLKTDTEENILTMVHTEEDKCELDDLRDLVHEFPLNDESIGKFDTLVNTIKDSFLLQKQKFDELNIALESSIDVIFRVSKTGKITYLTPSIKELLGYEVEEVLGKSIIHFLTADEKNFGISVLIKVFREKGILLIKS